MYSPTTSGNPIPGWVPHAFDEASVGIDTYVPVEGGTGRAVVFPAASTLREEMAVSGQRLLAASGQIPMAAHNTAPRGRPCRVSGASPHLAAVGEAFRLVTRT